LLAVFLLISLAAIAVGGAAWEMYDNFHTVVPDLIYRSGQLDASALECQTRRHHLRAVINLRGANPQAPWYEEERETAARLGLQHLDFPVDSVEPPSAGELADLLHLLDECDKPVLIHCQSGIDRSGLIAAIALLLLDDNGTPARAHGQLSLFYGHMPWRPSTARKETFLNEYDTWLATQGQSHQRGRFRDWALGVYPKAGKEQ
jgi:protein tyrosine/serine phosphatase